MARNKAPTDLVKNIPQEPGIYLMKNKVGKTLYVGKAKNLKRRVAQYYQKSGDDRKMVSVLINQVTNIDCVTTKNEKEALLLERNFIQKIKPKYNSILKDDRAYLSILLDKSNPWPRLELVRFNMLKKKQGIYFGPYTQGSKAKDIVNLIQQVFPLRRCSDHQLKSRSRPCILYNMKRCLAPCVDKCTKNEYNETLEQALQFLRGQRSKVLESLKNKRKLASEAQEFERAQSLHNSIKQIQSLYEDKKGIVQRRGEDADFFGLCIKNNLYLITKIVFRSNIVESSFEYKYRYVGQTESEIFTSFLLNHYQDISPPKTVVLPTSIDNAPIKELLVKIKRIVVAKTGHKKELLDMAHKNALMSLSRYLQTHEDTQKILLSVQKKLILSQYPTNIECIDVSHFSSTHNVAASISFIDGQRSISLDRIFKIKWAKGGDDYGATKEVLMRRLTNRELKNLPNLIIIDGARAHLNMAKEVLDELNLTGIDLISISKERGKHNKALVQEKIYILTTKKPIILAPESKELHLLQRIRDATHTKAINYQKGQRKF